MRSKTTLALATLALAGCQLLTGLDGLKESASSSSPPAAANPWNTDISSAALDPTSAARLAYAQTNGGFSAPIAIDFSLTVLKADASTPFKDFQTSDSFFSPDCDHIPFPVPNGGAVQGESGYACSGGDDCHLLVVAADGAKIYEMYSAFNPPGAAFSGGCVAVWEPAKSYPATLRGEGCTSADAAGLPVTLTTATPDEVATGKVEHALRFTIPSATLRNAYVHPATHALDTGVMDAMAIPMGARLRLRASFDVATLPTDGARALATAWKKYGAIVAGSSPGPHVEVSDGRFSSRAWADVGVTTDALSAVGPSDLELVASDAPHVGSPDCVRNP